MKASTDRFLITHVGSLPRGRKLHEMLFKESEGQEVDTEVLAEMIEQRVAHLLKRQREVGIDVPSDGEVPRAEFHTYVKKRIKGFGGSWARPGLSEFKKFPEFVQAFKERYPTADASIVTPQAVAEIKYEDLSRAEQELGLMRRYFDRNPGFAEGFVTSASPGILATTLQNAYYPSYEAYLFAIAREMRKEYELIVSKGFILQLDAPDLAMERDRLFWDKSEKEFLEFISMHIAALNDAIAAIPPEKVRLHVCWGNAAWPHVHDVPLAKLLPVLYEAKVGALSIPFANCRHAHEYSAFERHPLPSRFNLIAGMLDTTTCFVEHPELLASRFREAVGVTGDRERVIGGTDCGFSSGYGGDFVTEDVMWAKFEALRKGADLAWKKM